MSGEKNVSGLGLQSCQQQGLSKFKDDKRKPDREKVASDKDGKRKKDMSGKSFQEMTTRRSGFVPRASPFHYRFPPETSVTRLGLYWYIQHPRSLPNLRSGMIALTPPSGSCEVFLSLSSSLQNPDKQGLQS